MKFYQCGPVRVQNDGEALTCPWCGEDNIENPDLDRFPPNVLPQLSCSACTKVFTCSDGEDDPATIGMMTSADVRYIGQCLGRDGDAPPEQSIMLAFLSAIVLQTVIRDFVGRLVPPLRSLFVDLDFAKGGMWRPKQ